MLAIKKINRVFDHTTFAHRAMRELRILRCLGNHENVSISKILYYFVNLDKISKHYFR